jgi:cysteine desulfurase
MIYLDWAASAPPEPQALETLREISGLHYANPSSPHVAGRIARDLLEDARRRLSNMLGGGQIVFTSGATESNSNVLLGLLARTRQGRKSRIVTSGIEHASVFEQARLLEGFGLDVRLVASEENGIVDPRRIAENLDEHTVMVSIMAVNNETGAVQNLRGIAHEVLEFSSRTGRKILLHTDAAQGFGKTDFTPCELGVDVASLSSHKIGGPRGVGAMWIRDGVNLDFLIAGGGQEAGKRPGTENLPGVCAMLSAAQKRISSMTEDIPLARERMNRLSRLIIQIPEARIFPAGRGETSADNPAADRFSPYILCFGFPPLPGEVVVRLADSKGFCIGSGAACTTRKKVRTRVLESMGIRPEAALCAIRVSIGPSTTDEEIDSFAALLKEEVPALLTLTRRKGA